MLVGSVKAYGQCVDHRSNTPRRPAPPDRTAVRHREPRRRSGCDSRAVPQRRLRERHGRTQPRAQSRPHRREHRVHRARGTAGARRSRDHRRPGSHRCVDCREAAADACRRSVEPQRRARQPAAAAGARPLSQRHDQRAAPRRREPPRSPGVGGGRAGHEHHHRRRLRAGAPRRGAGHGHRGRRPARRGAARLVRDHLAESVRHQPFGVGLLEPDAAPAGHEAGGRHRVPRRQHVPRAEGVQHAGRRVDHADGRAAVPVELQLPPAQRDRRSDGGSAAASA